MCDNSRFNAHFPDDGDMESDSLLYVTPMAEFKAKKSDVGGLKKVGDACWIRYKVKQVGNDEIYNSSGLLAKFIKSGREL